MNGKLWHKLPISNSHHIFILARCGERIITNILSALTFLFFANNNRNLIKLFICLSNLCGYVGELSQPDDDDDDDGQIIENKIKIEIDQKLSGIIL